MTGLAVDLAFWIFAAASAWFGWRVFRTDSMVRASFALMASFLAVSAILILLLAEYLGVALIFMMAVEMTVMALFMVAFMMNPAGLNPMSMVHQHRTSIAFGILGCVALALVAIVGVFPDRPLQDASGTIRALGIELLGDSMLVFESAGVTLLATMLCAVILSSRRGRYPGDADEGSTPPQIDPDDPGSVPDVAAEGGGHGHGGSHQGDHGHERPQHDGHGHGSAQHEDGHGSTPHQDGHEAHQDDEDRSGRERRKGAP